MARAVVEPASPVDAFNPPDNRSVIMHDDVTAQAYKAATANARQRQASGLAPEGSPVTGERVAPSAPGLPYAGVARAAAGKEIQRLRSQVEAGKRDLACRFVFTGSGQQVSDPALLAMRAELVAQIDAAGQEADRLSSMTDEQVRQWAGNRGHPVMARLARFFHRGEGLPLAAALQADAITLDSLATRVGGLSNLIRSSKL